MRTIPTLMAALLLLALAAPAPAAESYASCSGFINALPTTLSSPGRYCVNKDLTTAITSGSAILVTANNVTIDCNGFRVGNLGAGTSSGAAGVTTGKINTRVTGCHFRGFRYGVAGTAAHGLRLDRNIFEASVWYGALINGDGVVVRDNRFLDIGAGSTVQTQALAITGGGEVRGNIIEGVVSPTVATGMQVTGTAVILDNTIRGLSAPTARNAIVLGDVGRYIVERNRLQSTVNSGAPFTCGATIETLIRDNAILGYSGSWPECFDGGGNDQYPVVE